MFSGVTSKWFSTLVEQALTKGFLRSHRSDSYVRPQPFFPAVSSSNLAADLLVRLACIALHHNADPSPNACTSSRSQY